MCPHNTESKWIELNTYRSNVWVNVSMCELKIQQYIEPSIDYYWWSV